MMTSLMTQNDVTCFGAINFDKGNNAKKLTRAQIFRNFTKKIQNRKDRRIHSSDWLDNNNIKPMKSRKKSLYINNCT